MDLGSNAGAFRIGGISNSFCCFASSTCSFFCWSFNLSASSSALSSSSIACSCSFFLSASSCTRAASSSRILLANHFFMPPSPAYGFVPLTPSRSFILLFPFPFFRSRSRSCISTIGRFFLGINISGIGAPLRRDGRRGVLYTSSSCKAFSAAFTGHGWAAAKSSMIARLIKKRDTHEEIYLSWIPCQTERIPVEQVSVSAVKSCQVYVIRRQVDTYLTLRI